MSAERSQRRRRAVFVTALFVFCNVAVFAGAGALVLVARFEAYVREGVRQELGLVGASVARALAQQYQKAVDYGIPLESLPGIKEQLTDTLERSSGLTRIALIAADGRELGVAVNNAGGDDLVSAPVDNSGQVVARIEVVTSPAALADSFSLLRYIAVGTVAFASLAASLVAGLFAGRQLARREERFEKAVEMLAESRFTATVPSVAGFDPVAEGFRRFAERQREIRERRLAFDAYADELLAVDFDERVRPEVELIRAELDLARLAPRPVEEDA